MPRPNIGEKNFVTLSATPEFIGRLRTWCRDERRQLRSGILFLIEEGLNARNVQADPALVEAERANISRPLDDDEPEVQQ